MAGKKRLILPRGYLSWTQVDMWRRSRDRYIRRYMLGENVDIDNSGIRFGKVASEALESGDGGADGLMGALISLLPSYKRREHELRVPMATPEGEVELLGKLDTFDPETVRFREYKTGRVPWTQKKAEGHFQLRHYQTMIWLAFKRFAPVAHLDWAETEEVGGVVSLTGRIQTFEVAIGMKEILEYAALAGRVAREIDAEYRAQMDKLT